MRHRTSEFRSGYLLIEMLIYVALFLLVSGLSLSAFFKCLTISQDVKRNAENTVRVLRGGEQWRQDMRVAQGAPELLREHQSVALEIPVQTGRIVYLFHNETIWRRKPEGAWDLLIPGVKHSVLARHSGRHTVAWSWDIELKTRKQIVRMKPLFSFLAVEPVPMNRGAESELDVLRNEREISP